MDGASSGAASGSPTGDPDPTNNSPDGAVIDAEPLPVRDLKAMLVVPSGPVASFAVTGEAGEDVVEFDDVAFAPASAPGSEYTSPYQSSNALTAFMYPSV